MTRSLDHWVSGGRRAGGGAIHRGDCLQDKRDDEDSLPLDVG